MRTLLSSFVIFCMACGAPEGDLGAGEQTIVNGNWRDPQTYAVARIDAGGVPVCSGTLIANDLLLVPNTCNRQGATVTLGGRTTKVRVWREPWSPAPPLVVLQTYRPFEVVSGRGLSDKGYRRDVDQRPLTAGEHVSCYGWGGAPGPAHHAGQLTVTDVVTDRSGDPVGYYLAGGVGFNGAFDVAPEDVGGYCELDGGRIVAILTESGQRGVSRAAPVHRLFPALDDLRLAADLGRREVALSFLHRVEGTFLTSVASQPPLVSLGARRGDTSQAFYLWDLASSPVGQTWGLLVSARDGLCLTEHAGRTTLTSARCDPARRDQQFWLDDTSAPGTLLRLGARPTHCVDAAAPGVTRPFAGLVPCAASAAFDLWLNRF
jgi:hypothetical protein